MEEPPRQSLHDLKSLHQCFRENKHAINNSLAVMMALAELSMRNPQHYEELSKAVLTRGQEIVANLQNFQNALEEKLGQG